MSISEANNLFRQKKYKEALDKYLKIEEKELSNVLTFNIDYCKKKLTQQNNNFNLKNYCNVDLSIVVPIFNVEKFLYQALNSLKLQKLNNIEIILINDGSTDNSASIAEDFAKKDQRFKLFNLKKNTGYGRGCNLGLNLSSGRYVTIFEPDDYIENNTYFHAYTEAIANDAEVVFFGWQEVFETKPPKESNYRTNLLKSGIEFNKVINIKHFPKQINTQPAVWSFICKREFLKKIDAKFIETPGAFFQDISYYNNVLINAEKAIYLDSIYYNYRQHENQSVASKDKGIPILEYRALINSIDNIQLTKNKDEYFRVVYHVLMRLIASKKFHILSRLNIESARVFYPEIQSLIDTLLDKPHIKGVIKDIYQQDSFFRNIVDQVEFDGFLATQSYKPKENKVVNDLTIGIVIKEINDNVIKSIESIRNQNAINAEIIIFLSDEIYENFKHKYHDFIDSTMSIVNTGKNLSFANAFNFLVNYNKNGYIYLIQENLILDENALFNAFTEMLRNNADVIEFFIEGEAPTSLGSFEAEYKHNLIKYPVKFMLDKNIYDIDDVVGNKIYKASLFSALKRKIPIVDQIDAYLLNLMTYFYSEKYLIMPKKLANKKNTTLSVACKKTSLKNIPDYP